jgi:hypothetical protein
VVVEIASTQNRKPKHIKPDIQCAIKEKKINKKRVTKKQND